MPDESPIVHEAASGDIYLWSDPCGSIFLKVKNQSGDPVELNEHEARELAEILMTLANEQI